MAKNIYYNGTQLNSFNYNSSNCKKVYMDEKEVFSEDGRKNGYVTTVTVSRARDWSTAASISDYAFFANGWTGYKNEVLTVDPIDTNFTRITGDFYTKEALKDRCAISIGEYALFSCGYNYYGTWQYIDIWDNTLTPATKINTSYPRYGHMAAKVGNYALFAGGYNGNSSGKGYVSTVEGFDKELTSTIASEGITNPTYHGGGASVGNYAIFGGGYGKSGYSSEITAYNSDLTKSIAESLSSPVQYPSAGSVGGYAVFADGMLNTDPSTDNPNIDIYDENLTKTVVSNTVYPAYNAMTASNGDYMLIAGGYVHASSEYVNTILIIDKNLTMSIGDDTLNHRGNLGGATAFNNSYFLFGIQYAANETPSMTNTIDVFYYA